MIGVIYMNFTTPARAAAFLIATCVSSLALAGPTVVMNTSVGEVEIELFDDTAPVTVANFVRYVQDGFYDGTQFHRVIPGFVIQGGGFTAEMVQKETRAPIKNESSNGLKNKRGTLSMARTSDPDSATSQFFINLVDNANLNGYGPQPGYAVFGKVTKGMEIVDEISKTSTTTKPPFRDVPVDPITIVDIHVLAD
jgi:peptidyl-prolyl cis-trans isomerase A (cyclophilin A)